MPGDAEILAKGVSVSLTGGMAAGSLNRSPKSLWRTLWALRTSVCMRVYHGSRLCWDDTPPTKRQIF